MDSTTLLNRLGITPGEPLPIDALEAVSQLYAAGLRDGWKVKTKAEHMRAFYAHEKIRATNEAALPLAIAAADEKKAARPEGKTMQDAVCEQRRIPSKKAQNIVLGARDIAQYPEVFTAAGKQEISFDNARTALATLRKARYFVTDSELTGLTSLLIETATNPQPDDYSRRCQELINDLDETAKQQAQRYDQIQRRKSKAARGINFRHRQGRVEWGTDLAAHFDEADWQAIGPAWLKEAEKIRRALQAAGAQPRPLRVRLVDALHRAFNTGGPSHGGPPQPPNHGGPSQPPHGGGPSHPPSDGGGREPLFDIALGDSHVPYQRPPSRMGHAPRSHARQPEPRPADQSTRPGAHQPPRAGRTTRIPPSARWRLRLSLLRYPARTLRAPPHPGLQRRRPHLRAQPRCPVRLAPRPVPTSTWRSPPLDDTNGRRRRARSHPSSHD